MLSKNCTHSNIDLDKDGDFDSLDIALLEEEIGSKAKMMQMVIPVAVQLFSGMGYRQPFFLF